jgi:hypothetical protein
MGQLLLLFTFLMGQFLLLLTFLMGQLLLLFIFLMGSCFPELLDLGRRALRLAAPISNPRLIVH